MFLDTCITRLSGISKLYSEDKTLIDRQLFADFFNVPFTDVVPTRMGVGTYVLH